MLRRAATGMERIGVRRAARAQSIEALLGTADALVGIVRSIGTILLRAARMTALASVAMVFSQTGCGLFGGGSKEVMRPAAGNIAGEGTVEAKDGDNGNTEIDVRVKHLAAPAKVAADASVYVVWIRPAAGRIQNVGALEVDDELVGRLKTTTPHRAFTLTVTPEPSARMEKPTHDPVFTSDVSLED